MTHGEEWRTEFHQRIAEAIKRGRGRRMTGHELADATARLGYPITRSQIANYESGRKQGLDVVELLVIAAALDVAPLELLFPGEPESSGADVARPDGDDARRDPTGSLATRAGWPICAA